MTSSNKIQVINYHINKKKVSEKEGTEKGILLRFNPNL